MLKNKKTLFSILDNEIFYLVTLFLASFLFLYATNFSFFELGFFNLFPFVFSLILISSFYFILNILFNRLFSFFLVCSILIIVSIVDIQKFNITLTHLSFNDFLNIQNYFFAIRYLTSLHIFILSLIFTFFLFFFFNAKVGNSKSVSYKFFATPLLFIFLILFLGNNKFTKSNLVSSFKRNLGLNYIAYDFHKNVKHSGLIIHLVQTAFVSIPAKADDFEVKKINFLRSTEKSYIIRSAPRKIIFVLCEACWNDSSNFKKEFEVLSNEGFISFRSISPSYGGNTPKATFEILTGLPANNPAIQGTINQEYISQLSLNIESIPSKLRSIGYKTISAHNYDMHMWNRDILNPKYGFEFSYFLNDMHQESSKPNKISNYPDDELLYEHAYKIYKENKDNKLFLDLITVQTHGSYSQNDDFGYKDYKFKLGNAINSLSNFIKKIKEIDEDVLIVLYGDHKPNLSKFFVSNKILPEVIFKEEGQDLYLRSEIEHYRNIIGDVPVYVYYKDSKKVQQLKKLVEEKPFFCLSYGVDKIFLKLNLLSFLLIEQDGICNNYNSTNYKASSKKVKEYIYYEMLFKN